MRSTETVSKPAASAVSTAARACSARVTAAEEAERVVGEGLDAERESAHPQPAPRGAGVGRHVLGVDLEEDPGVGRDRQVLAAGGDDAREVLRRQQRRRSPAEVDGVEGPRVPPLGRGESHLGHQVLDEALAGGDAGLQHREVAVRADGRAERDVEVEPGRRHLAVTIASRCTLAACSPGSRSTRCGPPTAPGSRCRGGAPSGRCASTISSSCRAAPTAPRTSWRASPSRG